LGLGGGGSRGKGRLGGGGGGPGKFNSPFGPPGGGTEYIAGEARV